MENNVLYKKLLKVSKPLRYINNEINSVHKNTIDLLRVCLAFPDVYEVGMSHLGLKILYEDLNRYSTIYAERFFMPWKDAIDEIGKPIFSSLESKTPLHKFDIIGFSLQYELSYSNLLYTLMMSDIPLLSAERTNQSPIIVAGGPTVFNPAPVSSFIDVFFIGEMDEMFGIVLDKMHNMKFQNRIEKLKFLDTYDFTYIPNINKHKKVKRHICLSFSDKEYITKPVTPLMPIVQDRISVEISRGCSRGCRFCQAGMIYRPVREKDVSSIIDSSLQQLCTSGYNEVSLMSLSASDYSQFNQLLLNLSDLVKTRKISLSLPSMRADQIDDYIFEALKKVRRSGFTIAPEAGSQRMRDAINKNLSEEEILNSIIKAAQNGWNSAKLYFMIGLPTETDEDVLEIAELCRRLRYAVKKVKYFDITASVSNFVPKAFTPFQWYPQNSLEMFKHKQNILAERLRKYKIKFKFHKAEQSIMEGVFSRGTEELYKVLLKTAEKGIIFDGWSEFFSYDKWAELFREAQLDINNFYQKEFSFDEKLPWDNIDINLDKDFLISEYKKTLNSVKTEDCRIDSCTGCGMCDFKEIKNIYSSDKYKTINESEITLNKIQKYIITFEKKDSAQFLSAIDISRIFLHIFSIGGIKLAYSNGYNPQPKISYIFPLPVGVEGENELVFISAEEITEIETIINNINKIAPKGLKITSIIQNNSKTYDNALLTYELDIESAIELKKYIENGQDFYKRKQKNGKEKEVSINNYIESLDNNILKLNITQQGGFNILEFFKYVGYNNNKLKIVRKYVESKEAANV